MNTQNMVVRPHRKLVEKFTEPGSWDDLRPDDCAELEILVALPTELESERKEVPRGRLGKRRAGS